MRTILSDDQITAMLRVIEGWPTIIANLLERNAITSSGVDLSEIIKELNFLLSKHSKEIQALGNVLNSL